MPMTPEQWDTVKASSLEKAAEQLRINPIVPSRELGGWILASGSNPNASYLVKPKWAKSERKGHPNKSKGQYWWLLVCSCPAEASGFVLCWHKSAVYLYWQHCAAVKRMEGVGPWMIGDGPETDETPTVTPPAPTPEAGTAKGRPTRRTAPVGKKRPAGKPDGGVAPKKRPKSQ
jgi:hypothetical protein